MIVRIDLDGGTYTVINHDGIKLSFLRHGEEWDAMRDMAHSKLLMAMVNEIESLREELAGVRELAGELDQENAELRATITRYV